MITIICIIFVFSLLVLLVAALTAESRRHVYRDYDDEYTTTTTTVEQNYVIKGFLTRSFENGQPYVTDPVDNDKVWLNSNDDMYEDGDGNFWELR